MNALAAMTRSWPMLGALGAGLVLTALAAGAGGAPQVVLAGLGIAGLGWAALSLRAGRIVAPGTVLAVSAGALAIVGWLVAAGAMTDVAGLPLAAASVFVVAVALSAAFELRRRRGADAEPHPRPRYRRSPSPSAPVPGARPRADAAASTIPPTPVRTRTAVEGRMSLLGLVGGAALVAALATPALAATEAGRLALPHGEHGAPGTIAPLEAHEDPGHSH